MVEYLPSKQATWVRFPSPAFTWGGQPGRREFREARFRVTIQPGMPVDRNEREGHLMGQTYRKRITHNAAVAQLVERVLGKDEVLGSNPSGSSGIRAPDRGGRQGS
jgi:hypothetical protein